MPAAGVKLFFSGPATDAKFSPDGSTFYVTNNDLLRAVDVATGTVLATYRLGETAGALDVSPDGKMLVTVGKSNQGDNESISIFTVNLNTGVLSKNVFDISAEVPSAAFDVAFLASGQALVTFKLTNPLALFDPIDGSLSSTGIDSTGPWANLIDSADGKTVYIIGADSTQTTQVFVEGSGITGQLTRYPDPYAGAAIPPPLDGSGAIIKNGSKIFVSYDNTIYSPTLDRIQSLDLPPQIALGADFDEVNNRLFLAVGGGAIFEFDLRTGNKVGTYELGVDVLVSGRGDTRLNYGDVLQVDPTGKFLLVSTVDGIALVDLSVFAPSSTNGDDVITQGSVIYAGDGNDIIGGDEAGQQMHGERGNDTYFIYQGGDTAYENADEGNDTVRTLWVNYRLDDNIENLIFDGSGDAWLFGNEENNRIVGGPGDDQIGGSYGSDILDGGAGFDVAIYEASNQPNTVDLALTGPQNTGSYGVDTLKNFEGLQGSTGQDLFWGDEGDNLLIGDNGNDRLEGRGGADTLEGGDGRDTLIGGSGNDILDGGDGIDAMQGGTGDDVYIVDEPEDVVFENENEGIDTISSLASTYTMPDNFENFVMISYGGAFTAVGNDLGNVMEGNQWQNELFGRGGNDRLLGNDGNDLLEGGAGDDALLGGNGDDFLVGGPGNDLIAGGAGEDTLSYSEAEGAVSLNLNLPYAQDTSGAGIDTLSGVENIIGSSFGDILFGSSGENNLKGEYGSDTLRGLTGNDELFGGYGYDDLFGGGGNDFLKGDQGNDRVYGNAGNDVVNGDVGNDSVFGGGGNDTVYGGNGQDIMNGHAGDDLLVGGPGVDLIVGGQGADRFLFNEGHLGSGASATDRIKDFSSDQGDEVDLRLIDADTTTEYDQSFDWIGNAAFTGAAGELRTEILGNTTYVYGDTDGDGEADIALLFTGQIALTQADFVL